MSSMNVGKFCKKAMPDTTQIAYKGSPKSKINREKIHYYTACTTNEVGFPTILQKKDKKCLRTG